MSDEAGGGHELLIIKKGGGHHDEHHGGVWKIAFADFMTAMMAFFLVMWLISANDKTKAVIAKYFNPIELVDSTPQPRGLDDSRKDAPSVDRKPDDTEAKSGGAEPKGKDPDPNQKATSSTEAAAPPLTKDPIDDASVSAGHSEIELIQDPYAVIAEIADKKHVEAPKQEARTPPPPPKEGGSGAVGLSSGVAFRDPFEPQPVAPGRNPLAPFADNHPEPPPPGQPPGGSATVAARGAPPPTPAVSPQAPAAGGAAPDGKQAVGNAAAASAAAVASGGDDKPMAPAALKARLAGLVKEAAGDGASGAPKLDVRHTDEGTLISLTDSAEFSMFASASARPSAKTVALMGHIGHLLAAQKGGVTIRGFTDNHPFRSDTYDNWRLSTERAHIAQYMLLRGGLEEGRIDRIEGYADRRPKTPKDPGGPENRRIEILLRDGTP